MTTPQNPPPKPTTPPTAALAAAQARAEQARPATRESGEDARTRAATRAAAIRGVIDEIPETANEFDVPAGFIPEGWDYQWVRASTTGKPDPDNLMSRQRTGWEPVPVSRHPTMMPEGYKGDFIERKGLMLMERPLVISQEFRQRELAGARQALKDKEIALGEAPANTLPRDAHDQTRPRITTTYAPHVAEAVPE